MKTLRSKLEPTASENYMCANVLRGCLKIPHLLYHAKANSIISVEILQPFTDFTDGLHVNKMTNESFLAG